MSHFAAGCAVCGADLDTARFDGGPSLLQRFGSLFSAISYGPTISIGGFIVLAAVVYALLYMLG